MCELSLTVTIKCLNPNTRETMLTSSDEILSAEKHLYVQLAQHATLPVLKGETVRLYSRLNERLLMSCHRWKLHLCAFAVYTRYIGINNSWLPVDRLSSFLCLSLSLPFSLLLPIKRLLARRIDIFYASANSARIFTALSRRANGTLERYERRYRILG